MLLHLLGDLFFNCIEKLKNEVFKAIINNGFDYYNYINFNSESEFNTFKNKCKELAFFDTQIDCNYKDKFITLSTCDYTSQNARLVVVAKRLS